MLLETAIGDAYGAGFEYAPKEFVAQNNDLLGYRSQPKWETEPGTYTDDTQMSIATAEAVLEIRKGRSVDKRRFAELYLNAFRRDHRKGYAQGFYRFLCEIKNADEFLSRINPDSAKSGAAMRAGPLGTLPSVDQVIEYTRLQASLTHDTILGRQAACAAALMVHYFLFGGAKKRHLGAYLNMYASTDVWDWTVDWPQDRQVKAPGWQSVAASVTAIRHCSSLSEALRWIVSLRGDVDTAAAICMSAASLCSDLSSDIPPRLYQDLENGPYGRDFLIEMDAELLAPILL